MSAWCPRCQKHVDVRSRETRDEGKHERRVETLCAECGITLMAKTETLKPAPES